MTRRLVGGAKSQYHQIPYTVSEGTLKLENNHLAEVLLQECEPHFRLLNTGLQYQKDEPQSI